MHLFVDPRLIFCNISCRWSTRGTS